MDHQVRPLTCLPLTNDMLTSLLSVAGPPGTAAQKANPILSMAPPHMCAGMLWHACAFAFVASASKQVKCQDAVTAPLSIAQTQAKLLSSWVCMHHLYHCMVAHGKQAQHI